MHMRIHVRFAKKKNNGHFHNKVLYFPSIQPCSIFIHNHIVLHRSSFNFKFIHVPRFFLRLIQGSLNMMNGVPKIIFKAGVNAVSFLKLRKPILTIK